MSSFVQDWKCSKCKSNNACYEDFKDSEEGYIFECKDCKYMEVYRENVDTGKVIENYAGYEHYYNQQASEQEGQYEKKKMDKRREQASVNASVGMLPR